jgi:hypothetical protein
MIAGGLSLLFALLQESGYGKRTDAFMATAIFIGAGINGFLIAFLVDVFTDIRWFLRNSGDKPSNEWQKPTAG